MNKLRYLIIALSVLALAACRKDEPVSPTDPLPLPPEMETSKDHSVKPGDSFFDYCNGTWLKNTAIPASGAVGGLYDQEPAMQQRVEQLKASVPDIGHFFELMEASTGNPEAAKAYLDAQKARFPKPKTKEEAFETMGRMMADGIEMWPTLVIPTWNMVWKEGRLMGIIVPYMDLTPASVQEWNPVDFVPVSATKAGAENSALNLILKGMGQDPSLYITQPAWEPFWEILEGYPLEKLCGLIDDAWSLYDLFAAPELKDIARMLARASLNYTLSYHFQQQFLPPAFKEKYVRITKEIQASLKKRIQQLDWMSGTTKNNALDKMDNYQLYVAYPDEWYTDCVAALADCATLAEAVHRSNRGIAMLKNHIIGGNDAFSCQLITNYYDGLSMTYSDLTLVNAMYSPNHNAVFIYPAVLMPPFVPENVSEAYEYASFVCIGHEFTHGFDNQGSQYDKMGNMRNWWTVADKMAFEERRDNIVDCYNHLELDPERIPGVYGDGDRTQGENIADLGGFLAALDAYKAHLEAEGYFGEVLNDQLRKFYESFAHLWCVQYSDAKLDNINKQDVHSHARLRVNGTVMNTDLWYDLYGVDRNNILYLPKERRTYIW